VIVSVALPELTVQLPRRPDVTQADALKVPLPPVQADSNELEAAAYPDPE
jgi:hypothetical protein